MVKNKTIKDGGVAPQCSYIETQIKQLYKTQKSLDTYNTQYIWNTRKRGWPGVSRRPERKSTVVNFLVQFSNIVHVLHILHNLNNLHNLHNWHKLHKLHNLLYLQIWSQLWNITILDHLGPPQLHIELFRTLKHKCWMGWKYRYISGP